MTKVYGYSDDNLVIEGAPYPADEIGCFDCEVKVRFSDGTLIKAQYGKDNKGIWGIEVIEKGTAAQKLIECFDEDAELYSDVFEIDADYVSHSRHYING
jgi:hypothetical protein